MSIRRAITVNQTRQKLGNCSRSTVYRYVQAGHLPAPFYVNGRPYFWDDEVDAKLESGRVTDDQAA